MASEEQLSILKQGVEVWNEWRRGDISRKIDLSGADLRNMQLSEINLVEADLNGADLTGANFTKASLVSANLTKANMTVTDFSNAVLTSAILIGAYLSKTDLRNSDLRYSDLSHSEMIGAYFAGAKLSGADLSNAIIHDSDFENVELSGANLYKASLEKANLWGARLLDANLSEANLQGANLIFANFLRANLSKANLTGANLKGAILVEAKIDRARLSGCTVYGISAWDLVGEFEDQKDLVVSRIEDPVITVDNVEVAQFIYLLVDNKKIRDVINTLTSKTVLILGRFTGEGRKEVLDALRDKLRKYNLLPIVFDFERPTDRDYTETVQTLAGLSLFAIVDVTNPKSTPLEMEATVKQFKIPYVPIIDLGADKHPFTMMTDLQKNFHWVLPTFGYNSKEELLENIEQAIISRALEKYNDLRKQKAAEQKILTIDDLKKDTRKR